MNSNHYETWDTWHSAAVEAGVADDLAQLGREVMRDYFQHGRNLVDQDRQQLGANGEYMLQLALIAPAMAFHDFNSALIWSGASGLDGDVEAYSLLIERLGSDDKAEEAMANEEAAVNALKREHGHA